MLRSLILIFCLPLFNYAQTSLAVSKNETTKGHTQAIAEFLKAFTKTDTFKLDTFFLGPYEELYDKNIPAKIESKVIKVFKDQAEGEKKLAYRSSFIFANMIGSVTKGNANFKFITFFAEKTKGKVNWWPLHNCDIDLTYDAKTKQFKLSKLKFEYAYSNAYTKKK